MIAVIIRIHNCLTLTRRGMDRDREIGSLVMVSFNCVTNVDPVETYPETKTATFILFL